MEPRGMDGVMLFVFLPQDMHPNREASLQLSRQLCPPWDAQMSSGAKLPHHCFFWGGWEL